ncbi:cyclic nucleotide-binding domain-containing protein [bacterium]|nr:cyclic nucleotide-binding domain-containing protein [bacterium]
MLFDEKKIGIFDGFTEEELTNFLSICNSGEVKENEPVLEEGQLTRSLFIIETGEVSVTLEVNGEKIELTRLKKDDFFGEMSFLDGKMHSADICAVTAAKFHIVRKFTFDRFAKEHPEIAKKLYENIIKTLLVRLRNSNDIIKKLREEKDGVD